jgi:micrococcal nuclease
VVGIFDRSHMSTAARHPRLGTRYHTLLPLLIVIGLLVGGCQASNIEPPEAVISPITSPTLTTVVRTTPPTTTLAVVDMIAQVVSVTDGDTIRVLMPDGQNEPVRLIGIDAPEDGSILDQEATAYLEDLVLGEEVRMVVDVSDRDRFGRLLRYIYVGDLFVNEEMVRVGLAIAKRYEPDTAMASVLEAAQGGAEQAALGLFSPAATTTIATSTTAPPTTTTRASTTTTTQPPTTTPTVAATTTTTAQANCDSSYPDFCIPPPPPDLDCGDIGVKNFTVRSPDSHGFDGDSDGVGCES